MGWRQISGAKSGLEPDFLTIGKTIGGGIPAAAYGFTEAVAERVSASIEREDCDVGGIGGTLAGNALSLAAARAVSVAGRCRCIAS